MHLKEVAVVVVTPKAAAQVRLARRGSKEKLFSMAELDWFSRNSYNLALKYCTVWEPSQTLGLLQTCLKVYIRTLVVMLYVNLQ